MAFRPLCLQPRHLPPDSAEAKISLQSHDGRVLEVDRDLIIGQSELIKDMWELLGGDETEEEEDDNADKSIKLQKVSGAALRKVIDWAEYHRYDPDPSKASEDDQLLVDVKRERYEEMCCWDDQFFSDCELPVLMELLLAADFLMMEKLHGAGCKFVAHKMKNKTPEELRKMFQIDNDFTSEEEKMIREADSWCVEKPGLYL